MTTIYTVNNKVLKNVATDKWLAKKETGPVFDEVTIGSQTWMSKNLAIDDGQGGIYTQTVNYGQGNVVEYYYTWAAAVRIANSIPGWHLPTKDEWDALATEVGGSSTAGTKLKSTYGWASGNGSDDYDFAAFPAGFREGSGSFSDLSYTTIFWTSTGISSSKAYAYYFWTGSSSGSSDYNISTGYSIRLIKDVE